MLAEIYVFINYHTAFLYTVLFRSEYFFIDNWSLIHLVSGIILMAFLAHKKCRQPFAVLLVMLFSWECIEMSFIYFAVNVFSPEILQDQFTDIVVGFAGGLLIWFFLSWKEKGFFKRWLRTTSISPVEICVSCVMSFVWVSFYGYKYNVPFFNSPLINWLAFLLWSVGLLATIQAYKVFKGVIQNRWLNISLTWLAYFSSLLLVEYLGYYVFEIRLVTTEGPLIFGIIHGTVTLKVYYLIAGVCAVASSTALKKALSSDNFSQSDKNDSENESKNV